MGEETQSAEELRTGLVTTVTHCFQAVLNAGKALWVHHRLDRNTADYDYNVGYVVALRYIENPPATVQLLLTAAVLRSHCGAEALPAYVRTLRGKVSGFGVAVDDDGHPYIQPEFRTYVASIDLHGAAQDSAARGDMELDWIPFRNEAAVLWEAGFRGQPVDESVKAALTERIINTWTNAGTLAR